MLYIPAEDSVYDKPPSLIKYKFLASFRSRFRSPASFSLSATSLVTALVTSSVLPCKTSFAVNDDDGSGVSRVKGFARAAGLLSYNGPGVREPSDFMIEYYTYTRFCFNLIAFFNHTITVCQLPEADEASSARSPRVSVHCDAGVTDGTEGTESGEKINDLTQMRET